MNNHILIRNALLGSWNVGSEYIRLCGNEKFETPDELSSRFNIKRVYTKICTKSDALLDATQEISEVFVRALLQWRW